MSPLATTGLVLAVIGAVAQFWVRARYASEPDHPVRMRVSWASFALVVVALALLVAGVPGR